MGLIQNIKDFNSNHGDILTNLFMPKPLLSIDNFLFHPTVSKRNVNDLYKKISGLNTQINLYKCMEADYNRLLNAYDKLSYINLLYSSRNKLYELGVNNLLRELRSVKKQLNTTKLLLKAANLKLITLLNNKPLIRKSNNYTNMNTPTKIEKILTDNMNNTNNLNINNDNHSIGNDYIEI